MFQSTLSPDNAVQERPQRRGDLQERGLDGETLLLDRAAGFIHQFNETASFVWGRCDGRRPVTAIADELAQAFDIPPATARRDVASVVAQLHALGLLRADDQAGHAQFPHAPGEPR
jgi:hypothetical protein